jgi:hypothetical protein
MRGKKHPVEEEKDPYIRGLDMGKWINGRAGIA